METYTVAEACQRLKISRPTFYNEVRRGRLQTFCIGARRFVSERALASYISEQEKCAMPPQYPQSRVAAASRKKVLRKK